MQQFQDSDKQNIFHSSGYARAAHGNQIGASSMQSFGQRYQLDRNRRIVQRYHDSLVARGNGEVIRKLTTIDTAQNVTQSPPDSSTRRNATIIPPRPQAFKEPPSRGYNPFS